MMISSEKKIGRCISSAARRIVSSTVVRRGIVVTFGQPAQDVLDHDEIAVDDDAEIDRAEAQQVGGHLRGVHAREREQQRQRNGDRRQERGADAPERQRQHDDDDDERLGQRPGDRAQRVRDQIGAIVDRRRSARPWAAGWR